MLWTGRLDGGKEGLGRNDEGEWEGLARKKELRIGGEGMEGRIEDWRRGNGRKDWKGMTRENGKEGLRRIGKERFRIGEEGMEGKE